MLGIFGDSVYSTTDEVRADFAFSFTSLCDDNNLIKVSVLKALDLVNRSNMGFFVKNTLFNVCQVFSPFPINLGYSV